MCADCATSNLPIGKIYTVTWRGKNTNLSNPQYHRGRKIRKSTLLIAIYRKYSPSFPLPSFLMILSFSLPSPLKGQPTYTLFWTYIVFYAFFFTVTDVLLWLFGSSKLYFILINQIYTNFMGFSSRCPFPTGFFSREKYEKPVFYAGCVFHLPILWENDPPLCHLNVQFRFL